MDSGLKRCLGRETLSNTVLAKVLEMTYGISGTYRWGVAESLWAQLSAGRAACRMWLLAVVVAVCNIQACCKSYLFKWFIFPGGTKNLWGFICSKSWIRGGGTARREVTERSSFVFQAGSLGGFFSVAASCPTMTLRKMPGRVVREASRWLCVKFKVSTIQWHNCTKFVR